MIYCLIEEILESYQQWLRARGRREGTAVLYVSYCRSLLEAAPTVDEGDLLRKLAGYAPSTRRAMLVAWNQLRKWGLEQTPLVVLPSLEKTAPLASAVSLPAVDYPEAALRALAALTAPPDVSVGDVVGLKWKSLQRAPGELGGGWSIPVRQGVYISLSEELIAKLRPFSEESGWLFPDEAKESPIAEDIASALLARHRLESPG